MHAGKGRGERTDPKAAPRASAGATGGRVKLLLFGLPAWRAVRFHFLIAWAPYSTGCGTGGSTRSTTTTGALSVGLSAVPQSAAACLAQEISRAPVSFRVFRARSHHSGLSQ